jgi:hypothetical protein
MDSSDAIKVTKTDIFLFFIILPIMTIWLYFDGIATRSNYKEAIKDAYLTKAHVAHFDIVHKSKSPNSYYVNYEYTGFDGGRRAGKCIIDEDLWNRLKKVPEKLQAIDIYQSRSNTEESNWAVDWNRRANESDFEIIARAIFWGLIYTIPAFLLIRFGIKKLRKPRKNVTYF